VRSRCHRPERYEHELLKFWVRDRLACLGFQAECEQRVNRSQPDVRAVGFGRQLAVEVQPGYLRDDEVEARTAKLRAEEHEVLWLTRHCNWVQQQPAVNVRALDRAVDDSTRIGESYYLVREGVLCPDPSGELVAGQRDVALGTFLDLFSQGRIGWAMLRDEQYGWAVTEDWQKHLERQGRRVADLERQLQQALQAQRRLEAVRIDERRELTSTRSAVAATRTQLQAEQAQARAIAEQLEAVRDERDNGMQLAEQLEAVRDERDNGMQVAEQRGARLRDLQERLARTALGRRVLRQVDSQ
jgi:hypothetical protein